MPHQSTDEINRPNGVDAVGKVMRPVPSGHPIDGVPASKEFNGFEFDNFDSQQSTSK